MLSYFILLFHLVFCILIGFVTTSKPLSILLLEPIPSTSHHIWAVNLVKGLLRKGHHVHVVSIHEVKIEGKLTQNLTYAVFDGMMESYEEAEDYNPSEWERYSVLYTAYFTYQWGIDGCNAMIKTKGAQELLEIIKTVEFDVIVQDITLTQCLYGLWEVAKGKPSIVGYIPFGPAPWLKDFTGGPSYPTVRPYTHAAIAKPIGLWLRTLNTLYYIADNFIRHYYFLPILQRFAEEYVGHVIRPLHEIEKDRINIVLINTHSAFEPGIPLPPNTLEIAGLNAQAVQPIAGEVVESLPEDMRVFLDEAKNGAIVISLGTNVKWKPIGLEKIKAVIVALSKLKQRVLWKLDVEMLFQIPDNIMIVKWIPQSEVLSHKNVKAIWTHGGLLSTQEAIWKGIPLIVMPFFMDQKSNAQMLVAKGVGIYLDIKTLSKQSILHAVEEIFYNESYTKNMKQLSSEFRDRPLPPLDLAIWSIEYTVRHPNGSLVTPLRFQSWIEQNLIDVYVFLFLNFIIISLSIFFGIKILINFYYDRIHITSKLRKNKQVETCASVSTMSSYIIILFYVVCYILINFVTVSKPLSILLIQPLPSPSHDIWMNSIIKELLRKGHYVHVVSTIETKIENKLAQNLTYAIFENEMTPSDEFADYGPDEWEKLNEFYTAYAVYVWAIVKCDKLTQTNAAKELLEMIKTVKFDVIVTDITLSQCFYGLWEIAKGNPPIVGLIPLGTPPWLKDFIGGSSYPTIYPYISANIAKPIGLWQKTCNTLYYIVDDLLRHYYYLPIVQRTAEKYIGHTIRPLHEIEKDRFNILLINSHSAFQHAILLPPNALETGGLHIQAAQLSTGDLTYPEGMRMFLDEAKSGAIVISLGTNVKWKTFRQDKIKAVLLAFSKLKQRVLWKLDNEISFQIPNNVMVMKWIPQREVLFHRNVKAIWTHGGLLSTQEAIWEGIPMIITPFFYDQKSNAEILVAKGVGIRLDFKTLSTQSILHAIEEVLYNESYTKNMKQLSSEFRDRPLPPLDLAIWSIEYVVRHPNGSLATALRSQSWVEQNLIDVYAFLFLNLFIIIFSIFFAIKLLIKFCYNYIYIASKLRKKKQM
ncbi:uncharacterized protein LOC105833218 [Monomorium pharaonis]|uniref:uncharacterized protein LOC105833218 n=1 Tax=Monomorium pharaonis TaxID=307658 RepID=UPI00174733B7|nr:uncharacterized protein LOC105833218 [Monomorium pharaonis]